MWRHIQVGIDRSKPHLGVGSGVLMGIRNRKTSIVVHTSDIRLFTWRLDSSHTGQIVVLYDSIRLGSFL